MRTPVRVGLVGLGSISTIHMAAMDKQPARFVLTAVCDSDPDKLASTARPAYSTVEKMLDEQDIEVVVVATSPTSRKAVAATTISQGKHVVLEKPPTLSVADFDELDTLSRARHTLLYSALHFEFGRELEWFVQHRRDIRCAQQPIVAIDSVFLDPYVSDMSVVPRASQLFGSWADSGPNAVSVLTQLVRDIRDVAIRTEGMEFYDRDLGAECRLTFTDPQHGTRGTARIITDWRRGISSKTTTLRFTESSIVLDHSRERVVEIDNSGHENTLFSTSTPEEHLQHHYDGVYTDLFDHLDSGRDNRTLGRLIVQAIHADANDRP